MLQDPFRQDARAATDEELTALVDEAPVSRRLGRRLVFEESQVTDRVLGFLGSDQDAAFDRKMATVYGDAYSNMLTPAEANAQYGIEGELTFDAPVNAHRAQDINRQAQLRRYREQTAARAGLSSLDTLGASLAGAATDPVMLPTWFVGGGGAALRAMRVAPAATRLGGAARGATVGVIDGLTGGVVAEGINAGARLGAGENYGFGDATRNVLFGTVLGAGVGGATGGAARPVPRAQGAIADLVAFEARAAGEDAATAIRIAQLESGLNPRAKNPRSSAAGLFQFIDDTWARFGGGDKLDARLSARNGVRLLGQNRAGLTSSLGRSPTGWELYLAHQQGLGGARELLRDPSRPAVDALRAAGVRNPARALELNGGHAGMTAGQFADKWRRRFGGADGGPAIEALTPDTPPPVLRALTENERVGGFAEALEAAAEDAPLDLGPMLARTGADALDEASAVPTIRGEWLEADVAVARDGSEIPVRFAVVELDDLRTSHTDDLTAEADYPAALQPRDRSRPGSQVENYELERELNPKLLMKDRVASGGAPIVSPDGLVESGNGRVIAVRRSSRTGTDAWKRYGPELARTLEGRDLSGFRKPVLVRMRTEPMTGRQRAAMAELLNRKQTEAYSPVEQALSDARRLDPDMARMIEGDDPFAAANRPFQRAFQDRVAPGDKGMISNDRGEINPAGRERVRAALVQAAYGDRDLTEALFESTDPHLKAVGEALAEAAPAWLRMKAEAPAAADLSANLAQAAHLLRHARASREPTDEVLARLLAGDTLFSATTISPETEALLRMMFRDPALTRPRGAERLAAGLKLYAREAAALADGPNLFGESDDPQTLVRRVREWMERPEGDGRSGLAWAGGDEPRWSSREIEAAVLDLRPAEPDGGGPGGGGERPGDGGRPARPGGPDQPDATLSGEEIAPADTPTAELRRAARAWYDENLLGATVEAEALGGRPVEFRKPTKAFSFSGDPRKLRLTPALADMIRTGRLKASETSYDARQAAAGVRYHRLEATAEVGGDRQTVRITLFEDANGRIYYDHRVEEADPAGRGREPSDPANKSGAEPTRPGEATARNIIENDPELKALAADTEAMARAAGIEVPAFDKSTDPSTVAEGIRAAAWCLTSDFDVRA